MLLLTGDVENTKLNAYRPSLEDSDLVTVQMWEPKGPTCSSWGGKSGSGRVHAARQPCPGAVVAAETAGRWEVRGTWGGHRANALGARLLAAADRAAYPPRPSQSQILSPRNRAGEETFTVTLTTELWGFTATEGSGQ